MATEQLLQDSRISKSDQERNRLTVREPEIVKFYQEDGGGVRDTMVLAPELSTVHLLFPAAHADYTEVRAPINVAHPRVTQLLKYGCWAKVISL